MLKVLNSGFYTTLQDNGRFGYREYGVPVSGAMDRHSSQFANTLLGNTINDAVLEMTMLGGVFQFTEATMIAISGADMSARLNNISVHNNNIIAINVGDILSFGRATIGIRTYLAIKGGFKTEKILNSRSQYHPITVSSSIKKEDVLGYDNFEGVNVNLNASVKYDTSILCSNTLEVFTGPEFYLLKEAQKQRLFSSLLKVSNYNNRMAYQFEEVIQNNLNSILTSPVLPGTVQLTPSGKLIVLMRDCQTTGGYPRVLQLTEKAINILSQKVKGNSLEMKLLSDL